MPVTLPEILVVIIELLQRAERAEAALTQVQKDLATCQTELKEALKARASSGLS